jgi:hypothetical protein
MRIADCGLKTLTTILVYEMRDPDERNKM